MRPDPFSDPGDGGQQPDSSLPPAGLDGEPGAEAGLVNITGPWSALTGQSAAPADVAGIGLAAAADARDLAPWCMT